MAKSKKKRGNRRNLKLERVKDQEREDMIYEIYLKNKMSKPKCVRGRFLDYPVISQEDFKEILNKSKNDAGALDEVSDEEFQRILEDIRIETENEEDRYLQEIIIKLNDSELNHRDHSKIYSSDILENIEDSSIISIIEDNIKSISTSYSEDESEYEYSDYEEDSD